MGLFTIQLVEVLVTYAARAGVVVEAIFAPLAPACLEAVLGIERVAGGDAGIAGAPTLDFAECPVGRGDAAHVAFLAVDAQGQILAKRACGVDGRLAAGSTALVVGGALCGEGDGAFPFVGGPARDDVDHATQCLGAIERRQRATDHFHPLHGRHGHPAILVVGVPHHVIGGRDASAVDQHQGVSIVHATQAEGLASARLSGREGKARGVLDGVEQIIAGTILDMLPVDHRDRGRGGDGVFLVSGGRDGDGGQAGGQQQGPVLCRPERRLILGEAGRLGGADHGRAAGQGDTGKGRCPVGSGLGLGVQAGACQQNSQGQGMAWGRVSHDGSCLCVLLRCAGRAVTGIMRPACHSSGMQADEPAMSCLWCRADDGWNQRTSRRAPDLIFIVVMRIY